MAEGLLGELVPVGGGDAIPLMNDVMTIGRRESCDICLKFQNISGTHCELSLRNGVWHLRDLNSTNGVKVNGERTLRRPLRPGDEIDIAKHKYVIQYQIGSEVKLEEVFEEEEDNVFGQSLMEKAGNRSSFASQGINPAICRRQPRIVVRFLWLDACNRIWSDSVEPERRRRCQRTASDSLTDQFVRGIVASFGHRSTKSTHSRS